MEIHPSDKRFYWFLGSGSFTEESTILPVYWAALMPESLDLIPKIHNDLVRSGVKYFTEHQMSILHGNLMKCRICTTGPFQNLADHILAVDWGQLKNTKSYIESVTLKKVEGLDVSSNDWVVKVQMTEEMSFRPPARSVDIAAARKKNSPGTEEFELPLQCDNDALQMPGNTEPKTSGNAMNDSAFSSILATPSPHMARNPHHRTSPTYGHTKPQTPGNEKDDSGFSSILVTPPQVTRSIRQRISPTPGRTKTQTPGNKMNDSAISSFHSTPSPYLRTRNTPYTRILSYEDELPELDLYGKGGDDTKN